MYNKTIIEFSFRMISWIIKTSCLYYLICRSRRLRQITQTSVLIIRDIMLNLLMASFRCYNNSDVIATLITTNFHLYLIHLWWQLFQMFVYGDVVYAQTWQVLTLKNCMEPFSYASTAYLVASALVSVRLFCKNLGNLQTFFGQMVYRPPGKK